MDPEKTGCPNPACPLQGHTGAGNISLHSKKEKRLRCRNCGKTFVATKGTPFYRRRYDETTITRVVTLLAYGCPVQAICEAFSLDERTVSAWHRAAGQHCEGVHQALVENTKMDLKQVQADELRIKAQGQILWMALALCVPTRLWLGGLVSAHRDQAMARALALKVRACALARSLLVVFDGFSAYVAAMRRAFRTPLQTGRRGRPRLVAWPRVVFGRIIKSRKGHRLERIERQVLSPVEAVVLSSAHPPAVGAASRAEHLLSQSQAGGVLNTAYIERFNATMRSLVAALARRSRALIRLPETLEAGMYLAGCVYNFCSAHQSLARPLVVMTRWGERQRWVRRTPAMAAGLTDHRWCVGELLRYQVPLKRTHYNVTLSRAA